jgi:Flp pilus assembly protein TadG
MNAPDTPSRRHERGVVFIWTALFLLLMLGFVAIGIDVAKVMATQSQLQNAADAAALAGASAVNLVTGKVRPDSAVMRAQQTAARNKAFVDAPTSVTLAGGDIVVDVNQNTVKVTTHRNAGNDGSMVTHVAQVLGFTGVDLQASATAKAEWTCEQCEKLVPMGAIPPGNGTTFTVGQAYTLFQGQGGGANGNWQAVDFPDCNEGACAGMPSTGANTFRCLLANGYGCCVRIGQVIQTEPGQMNGPARQGLQQRWDRDTDRRNGITYAQYTGNGSRVVNVPIITPIQNGRTDVTVIGMAAFLLLERPTGGPAQPVQGEFIHDVVPGTGGNCTNSTVFTLRLIQ